MTLAIIMISRISNNVRKQLTGIAELTTAIPGVARAAVSILDKVLDDRKFDSLASSAGADEKDNQ